MRTNAREAFQLILLLLGCAGAVAAIGCGGGSAIAPTTAPQTAPSIPSRPSPVASATPIANSDAWNSHYLFFANNSAAFPELEQTATANTILSVAIIAADPKLQVATGAKLADSIAKVGAANAPIVFYDNEHWVGTPASEQADPVGSIASAASAAHSNGHKFGVASDGKFYGIDPPQCTFKIQNGIIPKVDWTQVDYVNLQEQMLASDNRCGGAVTQFVSFAQQAVKIIRAANPRAVISAQLSLRDSSPQTILSAIASVQGTVDAIYMAYPPAPCGSCTPSNLGTVLKELTN